MLICIPAYFSPLRLPLLGLIFLFTLNASAQSPQESFLREEVNTRELSEEKWEEITKNIDYSGNPEPDEETMSRDSTDTQGDFYFERRRSGGGGSLFGAGLFRVFAVMFLIIVVALIAYYLVNGGFGAANQKVERTAVTLEDIEENIHETDPEGYIRAAKEKGDYALAIRLYYLTVLKQLSLRKLIKRKRDKTNGEYLRELRGSDYFADFREVTRIFENIRYGGGLINESEYLAVEPKFRSLTRQLKTTIVN